MQQVSVSFIVYDSGLDNATVIFTGVNNNHCQQFMCVFSGCGSGGLGALRGRRLMGLLTIVLMPV